MHEISIVQSITRTLEATFEPEKLEQMKAIYLKVGLLSNVEPRLLHNAYEAYYESEPMYRKVELHIESVPIKIHCEACNHTSGVENYRFVCEKCNSPTKNIIHGEEMLIHKIEFNDV